MVKGILFDLDATLCNSEGEAHRYALKMLYDSFSKDYIISHDDFEALYKKAKGQVKREHLGTASSHERLLYIQKMIEILDGTIIPERILQYYHVYWDNLVSNLKLLPNVLEVLQELKKKGIKTCVVSNLASYVQLRKLKQLELSELIDHFVSSQESGVEKPHPGIYLMGMHKIGCKNEEVLMVGDMLSTDIEGAKHLDIKTIWFPTYSGNQNQEISESNKPDYIISDFIEILKYI